MLVKEVDSVRREASSDKKSQQVEWLVDLVLEGWEEKGEAVGSQF